MAEFQTQWWELPTVYEMDFTAAEFIAGATINRSLIIQADSAFKWTKASYYADIAGAVFTDSTRPIPQASVSIQDTGSSRQLFNLPVPVPNLFGTGQLPFIQPVQYVFRPKSAIQVTAQNFSAATAYNLKLSFIGSKIYEGAPDNGLNGYVQGRYSPLTLAGQVNQARA